MSTIADFMHLLACPDCKASLVLRPVAEAMAWLHCASCDTSTPVIEQLALFTETMDGAGTSDALRRMGEEIAGPEADYLAYIEEKNRRKVVDAYCAFDPFNESSQCARQFLGAAGATLAPGSAVLDLGLRSGWSGAWLAGRFADQQIVSVCWTGSGALGYRGARHWFGAARRSPNQLLVFSAIGRPLPLRDGTFALVHAHDCLHKSPDNSLLEAALASGARDAALVFAHIHLSDSEPEPYFERGGVLRPGAEYREVLERHTAADGRGVRLVAESALFEAIARGDTIGRRLELAPGYNGIAMVAAEEVLDRAFSSSTGEDASPDARVLINPLLLINPLTGSVSTDPEALGGRALEMLERHPPFAAALRRKLPAALEQAELQILRIAESGASIEEIPAAAGIPVAAANDILRRLTQAQVALPARLSLHHYHLSRFHSNDRSAFDDDLTRVLAQWAEAAPHAPGGLLFSSEVDRSEALRIVQAVARYLLKIGLQPGEPVAFGAQGADGLWPLLACLCVGALPATSAPGARVAVSDVAQGGASHEISLVDAGEGGLAELLDAYIDIDAAAIGNFGNFPGRSTRDWDSWITIDSTGRLCRQTDAIARSPMLKPFSR